MAWQQCPHAPVCLFPVLCLQLWPQWWSWSGWETFFSPKQVTLQLDLFPVVVLDGENSSLRATVPGGACWLHLTPGAELTLGCASTAVKLILSSSLLRGQTSPLPAQPEWVPLPCPLPAGSSHRGCAVWDVALTHQCGAAGLGWISGWVGGWIEDQDMGWGCFRKYSGRRNTEGKHLRQWSNHCPYLSVISWWLQLAQAQTAARAEWATTTELSARDEAAGCCCDASQVGLF